MSKRMRKPATAQPQPPQPLAFSKRGHRRKPDFGLYYRSRCGNYALYLSDQVAGIPVVPVRWLAVTYADDSRAGRVVSRHRKRSAAEAACLRHSRRREIEGATKRTAPNIKPR